MLPRALKSHFAGAIKRLLRPIVRQVIAYGLHYQGFDRLVREVFLDVAETDFALPFKRQTDSRLALITGLNRKEISSLRQRASSDAPPREIAESPMTRLLGRWMAGPPYASPDGAARRLPYESDNPNAASFARLAREVVGVDLPVRSLLDELLHTRTAEMLPNGDVVLRQEAHLPAADTEAKLALLGSDPGEVFSTIVHNIENPNAARLQRKVVYDNIGADALPTLTDEARRLGEEFVRKANALLSSYDRDRHPNAPGGARTRVVLATYHFEEPVAAAADDNKAKTKTAKRKPAPRRQS